MPYFAFFILGDIMRADLQARLNEFLGNTKYINTDWFKYFFSMLDKCDVDENIIAKYMDYAFAPESIAGAKSSLGASKKNVFNNTVDSEKAIREFFDYMESISQTKGMEYLKTFLENGVGAIEADMATHKEEGHTKNTCFFNMFLRQLIKENPQGVKLESLGTHMKDITVGGMPGNIEVVMAGVSLGHLHFEEDKSNVKTIQFTEFRTLPGLEKLGLGSYMFQEFCREICAYKDEYSALAWSVKKGKDGEKAYSKWGAYPIDATYSEDDGWGLNTTPLTKEEYDAWQGQMLYYFTPDMVKKNAAICSNRYDGYLTERYRALGD